MDTRARAGYSVGRGLALSIPFLLFFAGVFFASMYLFQSVVEETASFGMLVGRYAETFEDESEQTSDNTFIPSGKPAALSRIPSITLHLRHQHQREAEEDQKRGHVHDRGDERTGHNRRVEADLLC